MDTMFLTFSDDEKDALSIKQFSMTKKVRQFSVLKPHNILLRIVRRFHLLSPLPFKGIWFGNWTNEISDFNKIVCVACLYSNAVLKWIRKKNKNVRLISYFWDSVDVSKYPIYKNSAYENWSFSESDAQRFDMHYNPQFYLKSNSIPKVNKKYDVSFVGSDRNGVWGQRTSLVNEYYERFKSQNLDLFFYYVSRSTEAKSEIRKYKYLSQEEYNIVSASSRAILEIVDPDHEWLTLRPLFALSNGIKLITNNKSIKKERFYFPENVFILGIDDYDTLIPFLKSEFKEIDSEILHYYEIDTWSDRFDEKDCK